MTDFRALTDEILQLLDYYIPEDDRPTCWDPWRERARAALDEPEPEGPTDEEIMDLMPQQMRDDFAAAARVMSSFHPDIDKTDSVFRMILNRHSVDHARAVLARWGSSSRTGTSPCVKAHPVMV